MNSAVMTTLAAHRFLPDYKNITPSFAYITHLIPPETHPQYQDSFNAYNQYSRALLQHLLHHDTITKSKAPEIFLTLQEHGHLEYGFDVFFRIVISRSPQLGGDYKDFQYYVDTLIISDGKPVLDFYLCTLQMTKEIELQINTTG